MITTLHIKNIGIIDDLSIDFNEGFNVLTGETGAGKTLIIDSLGIIAGGRFSKEMIRKGETNSFIEICLSLPKNELAMDGTIIVSREINLNGKNMCKINGRMVTVNELREFMKDVIDIHGQQDNQTLMEPLYHTRYLDQFIGKEIQDEKQHYIELFHQYKALKNDLNTHYGDDKEKQRRLDLLRYQYHEIEMAKLKETEEEELDKKRKVMVHSEKVSENLTQVDQNLSESVIDSINISIRALEKIESIDEKYSNKLTELKNIYYEVQELSRDIVDMKEEIEFDEDERNQVENRLDVISSLERKYGNTIVEIIEYKEQVKQEIDMIENLEGYHQKLKQQIDVLEKEMLMKCEKIENVRKKYAVILSDQINHELHDLEMLHAHFNVKVLSDENFHENGSNHVEFIISTNAGEEEKSLIKIASGGEMSRIMLAIKSVLADVDEVPVLIFDEIDTGISGKAGKAVSYKLKAIAKKHQVLCVTHLASIAAKGDYNYYISKAMVENVTKTNIQLLNEEETIREIARIATGDITEIALNHAKELRESNVT